MRFRLERDGISRDDGWMNGWETYGIVTLQSGRPFTVALLSEIDNSGTGRSILGFGANDRPNLVGNPELVESDDAAMVQHRGVRVPSSGHVWKCGQEYSGWSRISERERVAGEEHER